MDPLSNAVIGRIINKLPRKFFIPLAIIVLTISFSFVLYKLGLKLEVKKEPTAIGFRFYWHEKVKGEEVPKNHRVAFNPKLIPETQEELSDETGRFYSKFDKEEEWAGWEAFTRFLSDPKVLQAKVEWPFDNPNLWFQKTKSSPVFDFTLKSTPQNENKGNLVLAYGQVWRCIIAERNFNAITCEKDYASKNKLRILKTLTGLGKRPIKPRTEIIIEGSTAILEKNKLELRLLIKYVTDEEKGDEANFTFEFSYPSPDPKGDSQFIGVGLIDPNEEGIAVEFTEFSLLPR